MPPADVVRLRDAAREAVSFGATRTVADLEHDCVLTLALVKCIEIIGEAASKVSEDTRVAHPQIPWADIIGMRNRLIHAYFDVDVNRVLDTVVNDIPPLIAVLERAIVGQ